MHSTPKVIKAYGKAHEIKEKMIDEILWQNGIYTMSAFQTVMEHFGAGLAGKKSKAEYIKEPFLYNRTISENLTEEEQYERDLKKALAAEEMWIAAGRIKGLPETVI